MRSSLVRRCGLIVISALLQLLAFPLWGKESAWMRGFSWFCLVPWLYVLLFDISLLEHRKIRQATLLSYLCGVLWYFGNCYWIFHTMHIYEKLPTAASVGILFLFALYLGLYHGLFGFLVLLLRRKFSTTMVLLTIPFLWVSVEMARTQITCFPWDLLGYTQIDHRLLLWLAPVTGVMGISFVVAVINVLWLVPQLLRGQRIAWAAPITATCVMLVALFLPVNSPSAQDARPAATATLLQTNLDVGSEASADESKQDLLKTFTQLSLHPQYPAGVKNNPPATQIVVWPESPAPFVTTDKEVQDTLTQLSRQTHAAVISNAITLGPIEGDHYQLYNSALFFSAEDGYSGHYDKMHLVPFGEYTPYKKLFFFAGHLLDGLNFIPGSSIRLLSADGHSYGAFICYESIFGDEIRHFALDGAQVLVNISDDGWYGDTSAPWEHLDMVRMRAVENHRWVLRSTNTGITAAIDPEGRVRATLPRHIRSAIDVRFDYSNVTTFYAQYGDWFGWLCVFVTAAFLLRVLLQLELAPKKALH
jgi:apolipoprotein N-acyltransferase